MQIVNSFQEARIPQSNSTQNSQVYEVSGEDSKKKWRAKDEENMIDDRSMPKTSTQEFTAVRVHLSTNTARNAKCLEANQNQKENLHKQNLEMGQRTLTEKMFQKINQQTYDLQIKVTNLQKRLEEADMSWRRTESKMDMKITKLQELVSQKEQKIVAQEEELRLIRMEVENITLALKLDKKQTAGKV